MLRRLALASLLLAGLAAPAASDANLDHIAALISAAQGTFPATKLPTMCVAIHPNTASPEQNLGLLQKLHVPCVRVDIAWHLVESGMLGQYDWSGYDPLWTKLCKAGIRPIMIATYNNPLYAAGVFRAIAGKANIDGYKHFAIAMADHYEPTCPNMIEELFNEPSAQNWTTTPWSGGAYATMLAPVSIALKRAHPHVTIFSGGVGFDEAAPKTWITNMVSTGLSFRAVDFYAFHPYNFDQNAPAKTLPPEQMLIDVGEFAEDAAVGGQAKPIALTEYGFPLQALAGDLKRQGLYTARGMLAAIIGHYPFQTYYDLIDDGVDYTNLQNTFGLFRSGDAMPPFAIKPSGAAFGAIMTAMAGSKTFTVSFDPKASMPSIRFEKPNGMTAIIWTYDKSAPHDYAQHLGAYQRVSCHDLFGTEHQCLYKDEALSLSLTEYEGPIIVTAEK